MIGLALAIVVVLLVLFRWQEIQKLGNYGYLGAFLISVFGGATIIAPVPMTPAVFTLGMVMKPAFAPYLGPVFVGLAAGLGDAIGGATIYMTGYGGGAAITSRSYGRFQGFYERLMRWMQRRGSLVLFCVSAVVNPFFYPVALAAGASKFGIKKFFLIALGGKSLKAMTVAAAGYWGLGSLLRSFGIPI